MHSPISNTYLLPANRAGGAKAYGVAVGARPRCPYCGHLTSRHSAGVDYRATIEVWCHDCHLITPRVCLILPRSIHKRKGRSLS